MGMIQNPQEIHEAINAADDALIALQKAERSLESAGGWGIWDMLGGGFFSAMMKHGKIDQAEAELEEARSALRRLRNELNDLGHVADINLDMGDFLRFADVFFDGVIADWMAQSRIRQGQQQVQQAIRRVEDLRSQLWRMLS